MCWKSNIDYIKEQKLCIRESNPHPILLPFDTFFSFDVGKKIFLVKICRSFLEQKWQQLNTNGYAQEGQRGKSIKT